MVLIKGAYKFNKTVMKYFVINLLKKPKLRKYLVIDTLISFILIAKKLLSENHKLYLTIN